jgi:chorismate mutase
MSNSFLFFIVVVEAIIIIWLASKLTQYKRIDQLLADNKAENTHSPAIGSTENGALSQASLANTANTRASQASPVIVENLESGVLVDGEPEENIEEAKQLQWVMARCRYAEFYLEQLDDDYERGQFRHIIDGCVTKARKIADPFFASNALHSIILLLDQAGWEQYRDSLLAEVKDDIVKERIESELMSTEDA